VFYKGQNQNLTYSWLMLTENHQRLTHLWRKSKQVLLHRVVNYIKQLPTTFHTSQPKQSAKIKMQNIKYRNSLN